MKDALTPCSLPGKEPICIQFMVKVGIPASLVCLLPFSTPDPDPEQLLARCDFCFAPQTDFLIVRQKPRERERAGSAALGSATQAGWKRDPGLAWALGGSCSVAPPKGKGPSPVPGKRRLSPSEAWGVWVPLGGQRDNPGLVLSRWGSAGSADQPGLVFWGREPCPAAQRLHRPSPRALTGAAFWTMPLPGVGLFSK